jgi:phosphoglucomutase
MATVQTRPFANQKPGTSGLRKKSQEFLRQNYTENYLQSIFDCIPIAMRRVLIIGGDGRYPGIAITKIAIRMAAANGFSTIIVGRDGLLSTPATSHLVRKLSATAALVFTASHNPGGPDGDFGVKLNLSNGGPASDAFVQKIHCRTQIIESYLISEHEVPPLSVLGTHAYDGAALTVIDPVSDYIYLMEKLFDFDRIAALRKSGFRILFDGLNGVSGPYAQELFVNRLGFAEECLVRTTPLPDFGGYHPDPNPIYAERFYYSMMAQAAPDFGAACDSDADRHMIMGRHVFVTPSDSLAILAEHMHVAPGYKDGVHGVARSIGTSSAVDRLLRHRGLKLHETPTGWKYFGNLLEAGSITLCGEESSGAGSNHIREKDGIWAVLLWLSVIAAKKKSVGALLQDHWRQFGRTYYERRDYDDLNESACQGMIDKLRARLVTLKGRGTVLGAILEAKEFDYVDPVDGAIAERQGIVLKFASDARIVMRLSGTGTSGATLRVYSERHDHRVFDRDPSSYLEDVFNALDQVSGLTAMTKRIYPTMIS